MQLLTDLFIPLLLFVMMLAVGMGLTQDDFRRVRQYPLLMLLSGGGQLLLLPAIGAIVAVVLEPPPSIVAGMILVAASPGGAISNYYVYLARANVALSVTLTALSTLVAIFILPLITTLGFGVFLADQDRIQVPVMLMVSQLFLLLLLPVASGMLVRYRWPQMVVRRVDWLRRFNMLALALIILFVTLEQGDQLLIHVRELGLSASLYTLLSMAAGWGMGTAMKASLADKFTLTVEYSVRNLGVVTVVGASVLGDTGLVVFSAAFFLIQVPVLLIAAWLFQRSRRFLKPTDS